MAYPAPFHRIVMIGSLYGDMFNTSFAMCPSDPDSLPLVSDTFCTAVAEAIGTWWSKPLNNVYGYGLSIISDAKLTSVKVNRIGTDGHYLDEQAREHVFGTPIAGSSTARIAPQLSLVASFTGSAPRALAGRGRMYFPPSASVGSGLDATGRLAVIEATNAAKGVSTLLAAVEAVYTAAGLPSLPSITSKTRGGAFQRIQTVGIGRVIDTMRSRRSALPEEYVEVDVDDAP